MLIVTLDEHGGFYDHVAPPATIPTGDDRPRESLHPFDFKLLGIRVPALVISAYTERGTVIGADGRFPISIFDHTSVLATVEKRFGLPPMTHRDAQAVTLEVALNRDAPRSLPSDAPLLLPNPVPDSCCSAPSLLWRSGSDPAPMSLFPGISAASWLWLACDLQVTDLSNIPRCMPATIALEPNRKPTSISARWTTRFAQNESTNPACSSGFVPPVATRSLQSFECLRC